MNNMKEITKASELKESNNYFISDGLLTNRARFEQRNGIIYDTFPIYLLWNISTNSVIEIASKKELLLDEIHSHHLKIFKADDSND